MAKRPTSPRATRRARSRAHEKLVQEQERLAQLQPGGAPERPLQVESPAQVDVRAGATPCPLCEGPLRVDQHLAKTVGGVRLRVAQVECTACGVGRALYFRLVEPPPLH